jgi:prevent-host-death family protein
MAEIGAYEAKTHLPKLLERVQKGERFVITKHGRPVAELRPLRARGLSAAALLERWHCLPTVDPAGLRRDVDTVIDQGL